MKKRELKRKKVRNKEKNKNAKIKKQVIIFLICFMIIFLVESIGSLFTIENTKSEWYQTIKPSITPPNYIFPIVWNILFVMITFSLFYSWIYSKKRDEKIKIILFYGINFFLNIFWSFLFFSLKNLKFAFIEIILLDISTIFLILFNLFILKNKKAGILLMPYFIWLLFATFLNYLIFISIK